MYLHFNKIIFRGWSPYDWFFTPQFLRENELLEALLKYGRLIEIHWLYISPWKLWPKVDDNAINFLRGLKFWLNESIGQWLMNDIFQGEEESEVEKREQSM